MLKISVLITCLCVGSVVAIPALDEASAKKFIIESSDKFSDLYVSLVQTLYNFPDFNSTGDSKESRNAKRETSEYDYDSSSEEYSDGVTGFSQFFEMLAQLQKFQASVGNLVTLAEETYKFPIDQFKDQEVINGILKLRMMPGLLVLKDEYKKWSADDFDDYMRNKNFCKYNEKDTECKLKYSDISKVSKTSNNPDELLHYWKEWREKNLGEANRKMEQFVELNKNGAKKFGTSTKFSYFVDYLDENFADEMEKAVNDLEPLFKELHAYIRYILNEQYGDIVPTNGLIPHHLYEQVLAQAWKPDSVVSKEFKGVKMPISNNFKHSATEVMEIVGNFMKSLGLSEIPADFIQSTAIKNDDDDCIAELYNTRNGTFFKYCKEVNIKRYLQMHGYVTQMYYAYEHKDIPFAYTDPYNFDRATGEAVILSATTPKYLYEVGHKNVTVLPEDEDMNRLFRMGVHTLLNVPQYYIHTKVLIDVLDDKVPISEMNQHYWDLMKKYIGVAPPVERSADAKDFPYKFYYRITSNHQSMKFVSEIVGYQIYESLCEKSGEFVKGDATRSLHNCNFYNSKVAGKFLKNMMQLGTKKPWKQLLSEVTGDDTGMKGTAMVQYYKPLYKWLHTKNTEHKVTVGW